MSPTDAEDLDLGEVLAAGEVAWPPELLEMELRRPVTDAAETPITFLRLREPTGAEWEAIMGQPKEAQRRYAVSLVAGIPMATAAKIGIGDLVRAERYLSAFFEVGLAISVW